MSSYSIFKLAMMAPENKKQMKPLTLNEKQEMRVVKEN